MCCNNLVTGEIKIQSGGRVVILLEVIILRPDGEEDL